MDKTNYRTDCFAHKGTKCNALKVMNCHNCNFYKKAKGKAESGEKEKR